MWNRGRCYSDVSSNAAAVCVGAPDLPIAKTSLFPTRAAQVKTRRDRLEGHSSFPPRLEKRFDYFQDVPARTAAFAAPPHQPPRASLIK